MNILFVCKHNRFRSKVAEAFFKKYDKEKNKVRSRATKPDYIPVAENVIKALKKFGVKKINNKPRKLSKKDIKWSDIVVIVANNVRINKKDVKKKKILIWKISDISQDDIKGIRKRVKIIEKRVLNLLKRIK